MKLVIALGILASWVAAGGAASAEMPKQAPPADGTSIFNGRIFNEPSSNANSSSYSGQLQLYSEEDKEHVFTVDPSKIQDPSSTSKTNPNYLSSLSPDTQRSMGFQLSIPLSPSSTLGGGGGGQGAPPERLGPHSMH